MEEPLSMEITAALFTDYHFEDKENGKNLHPHRSFDALLKPLFSSLKKAASWFHSLALRELLLLEDSASGF